MLIYQALTSISSSMGYEDCRLVMFKSKFFGVKNTETDVKAVERARHPGLFACLHSWSGVAAVRSNNNQTDAVHCYVMTHTLKQQQNPTQKTDKAMNAPSTSQPVTIATLTESSKQNLIDGKTVLTANVPKTEI